LEILKFWECCLYSSTYIALISLFTAEKICRICACISRT
jgi:hypothetical protein